MKPLHENLKTIWFEGQKLPNWAQLLDLAARLCPVTDATKDWFVRFTNSSGVADSQTVKGEAGILREALHVNKKTVLALLQNTAGVDLSPKVFAAWEYSLETMIQEASSRKTCAWTVEGNEDSETEDGAGDISLRRI